jgi:hypothetical protein
MPATKFKAEPWVILGPEIEVTMESGEKAQITAWMEQGKSYMMFWYVFGVSGERYHCDVRELPGWKESDVTSIDGHRRIEKRLHGIAGTVHRRYADARELLSALAGDAPRWVNREANEELIAFLGKHGFRSHTTPFHASGSLTMFRDLLDAHTSRSSK